MPNFKKSLKLVLIRRIDCRDVQREGKIHSYEMREWDLTSGAASIQVPVAGREPSAWGHAGNFGTRVSEIRSLSFLEKCSRLLLA